jgi:DHA2 family multidrug resistance protein
MSDHGALAVIARSITKQAVMLATNDVFWISGWIFLGLMILVWFSRPPFSAGAS